MTVVDCYELINQLLLWNIIHRGKKLSYCLLKCKTHGINQSYFLTSMKYQDI